MNSGNKQCFSVYQSYRFYPRLPLALKIPLTQLAHTAKFLSSMGNLTVHQNGRKNQIFPFLQSSRGVIKTQ